MTSLGMALTHVIFPRPTNVREMQGFMGHCGYYRRFIFRFASITRPLYILIVIFVWMDECEESFAPLEESLTNAHKLV